jgi:hypothetical protein
MGDAEGSLTRTGWIVVSLVLIIGAGIAIAAAALR